MSQETKNKNLIDLLKTIDPANASYGGKRKLSKTINKIMVFSKIISADSPLSGGFKIFRN